MGKSATLIATVLALLLGLAAVAQASVPCQTAILECKTNKKGAFLVVAFSNDQGGLNNQSIEIGMECTEALDLIENDDIPNFEIVRRWINTGSQDRTVYTAITAACD